MAKKPKKIGVLLSGGLDSAALIAHYLSRGFEVWPVYVRAGLPWEKAELYWTHALLRRVSRRDLKPIGTAHLSLENAYQKNWSQTGHIPGPRSSDTAVFLPARNLFLVTKAVLKLVSVDVATIALATLKGNPFSDATAKYFADLQSVLSRSFGRPIKIHTPFSKMTKIDIIRRNKDFPLHLSFSCINPRGHQHCGRCNKCVERKRAFAKAGVIDETPYRFGR